MAILGNNVKGGSTTGTAVGRKYTSKFTLGSAMTLTELHGWFGAGSAGTNIILCVYADSAGAPGTRVAYTSPLAAPAVDTELQQTGFSVALAAGNYWIGWVADNNTTFAYYTASGSFNGFSTGATFNPPSDPFGTIDQTGARSYSCWAVVGAGTTWNGSSTVSLVDTITTAGASHGPAIHGASAVAETAVVTTAGAVRIVLAPGSLSSLVLVQAGSSSLVLVPRSPSSLTLTPA